MDREGHKEPLAAEPRPYGWPRVSPDGTRLAVQVTDPSNTDVWIYDLARGTHSRLTFDPAYDGRPLWTPDGRRLLFRSRRDAGGENLFWKAADGTGQAERLTTDPNPDRVAWSFTPDAKSLVFTQLSPETSWDLHVLSMEDEPTSQPLLQTQFGEGSPVISPDGRWIAYRSDETGQWEIYVRPFPNAEEGKWQISSGRGKAPVWAPKGQELFYRAGETWSEMMVVHYETEPRFTAGNPEVLFTGSYLYGSGRHYDISPDGQRFLMIKEAEQTGGRSARDELIV
ncbi:hypothetical protein MYX65_01185, partial [Acidobacteria bacterium AH-259-L09]|nr:hypothetical protein [Acidobacteria bacterium AH-259-L09]